MAKDELTYKPKLDIKITHKDEIVIFSFIGEISIFNLPYSYDVVSKIFSNHKYNFIFELSNVRYIDSFGIGFIISTYKEVIRHGGDLKLVSLSPFCNRIIKKVLYLDTFLNIFDTVEEALNSFKANGASALWRWQQIRINNPKYPDAYLNIARIFFNNGFLDEAHTEINKALEINPNYTEALNINGQIYLKKGQIDNAISCFKKILEIKPDDLEALTWLAICYDDSNLLDEAILKYKTAIEIYPKYADLHYRLGMAYFKKQDFDKAIECFNTALSINPNYLDVHRALATIYIKLKDKDLAIKHLKAISNISIDTKEINEVNELLNRILKNNFSNSYFLEKII